MLIESTNGYLREFASMITKEFYFENVGNHNNEDYKLLQKEDFIDRALKVKFKPYSA